MTENMIEEDIERGDVIVREIINDMVATLTFPMNDNYLCKLSKSPIREVENTDNAAKEQMEYSQVEHRLVNETSMSSREVNDDVMSTTSKYSKAKETLVTISSICTTQDSPVLTIVLNLSGLLLKRCWQKSPKHKSLKLSLEYLVLRPGCISFLSTLLDRFNVGIWSTASDDNLVDVINALEREAGGRLPFFMIWGQDGCQTCKKQRICRPDNPGAEALFKPLAFASKAFQFDARRTILIDDTPYKGCVNPANNCIFPPSFDINAQDNVLMGELLPYLVHLDHVVDVRNVIRSSRYGKTPILEGHEWYNLIEVVVEEWKDANNHWEEMQYKTCKLPQHTKNLSGTEGSSSSHPYSTRSQSKSLKVLLDRENMRLLKNAPSISRMSEMEAIMLAQKLGFKGSFIKGHVARSFLRQLQKQHGLK